ncbi:glycosyltransferase family 2 protein [Marimonas lutisalis]|uniref:glycosyltransferase family 2 protein n=1 Tax=Marimonas lutisalis TaxID=2545756 RepID=UPI0013755D76|nr:glycosyltransferase family 2 protein [Marimonas lutisalis]
MRNTHIAILMATYNGAAHLSEQLASIAAQSHRNWSLWISDDGSSDATAQIIEDFAADHTAHQITRLDGPRQGPTRNFLSLVHRPDIPRGPIAFADQDDVWLPDRLERGLRAIGADTAQPALYGSRTVIVDDDLKQMGYSPLFTRPPGFANAIVQSIAGGNTMLMNAAAHELLRQAHHELNVVTHDWWAYQLISAAGGRVIYDPAPTILYRQHDNNIIGSNTGLMAQVKRLYAVLNNRFRDWNSRNLAALEACSDMLTAENRALVASFQNLRAETGARALRHLERSGIYRQTAHGDRSLKIAAYLGKL